MLPVWSSRSYWRAGVSLNRVTGKQHPLHFEFIHRLIGYLMLSLTVVIYYFTAPETNYQIYLPFAFWDFTSKSAPRALVEVPL